MSAMIILTALISNFLLSHVQATQGLLISGGYGSVEVQDWFNNEQHCKVVDLPEERFSHTQNQNIVCGGSQNNETQTSCLEFTSGSWKLSHNLIYPRYGHTSWTTPDGGVLLVGGYYSNTTTEVLSLLSDQGDATELFSLEYPSSYSCLIDEGDTFLLVGGFQQENRVSRYNIDGWLENLDDLNTGRFNHGCTQYQDEDGAMVNVVCGGFDTSYSFLDSCEVNIMGSSYWTNIGTLPTTLAGLRGVNIGGHVLMTGGEDSSYGTFNDVYELDVGSQEWSRVGSMMGGHKYHALTVVEADKLWQYCLDRDQE